VPGFREIFEAILALPPAAAPSQALEGLSSDAQDALQRLLHRAEEERAAGVNFDEEYVGALRGLEARAVTRGLAPVGSVDQRQRQLKDLPPEQRTRFIIRNAAAREHRAPPDGPGSDHTQHS
jgi:hypothetical protein